MWTPYLRCGRVLAMGNGMDHPGNSDAPDDAMCCLCGNLGVVPNRILACGSTPICGRYVLGEVVRTASQKQFAVAVVAFAFGACTVFF